MRIDFFHIDLLNRSLEIKKVSNVETDCDTNSNYTKNNSSETTSTQRSRFEYTKDYLDIQERLHKNKKGKDDSQSKDDEFFSDEDLLNFKKLVLNNEYKISTKALAMSIMKHIERN